MATSMKRIAGMLIVGTASLAVLGPSGFSQEARSQDRPQQERPLRHEAAAVLKLIPVRVIGADGRPVTDLQKEDFALYEDGREKKITEFEVHTITEAGMVVSPPLPAPAVMAAKPARVMNRKFFLFLDVQRSDPSGNARAMAVANRFLDTQVRPGDEVAVLGFYSMSGFYIKEYLTTDMARVRRAIEGLKEAPPSAGEWHAVGGNDSVPARSSIPAGPGVEDIPFAGLAVFVPGTRAHARQDFVDRFKDVAEVFKMIPGNKSLVLFSSRSISPEIGKLFGATGTAIYAINTQDWMLLRTGDKVKHIWWDHPLKDIAAASGGRYFADINQVATIAQDLQDLTGNFYVLGYYVNEAWAGKYHKIRIEVRRPEARVLVQDGYADAKPFALMTDFEKDLQLIDLVSSEDPVSNPLPFPAEILISWTTVRGAQACLLARLDVSANTGPPAAKSEIFVAIRDAAGTELLSRRWQVDLGAYPGQSLYPYLVMPAPSETFEARLVVRDLASGEACVGRASFATKTSPREAPTLHSPLLLETGKEPVFLRLPAAPKKKGVAAELSILDLYPLIPKGSHPIVAEAPLGTQRLTLVLQFEPAPAGWDTQPVLAFSAKLISRQDGSETPLAMTIRDQRKITGRLDILVADIEFPAVSPGAYDLELSVEDHSVAGRSSLRTPMVFR